jgi:hypothetical protein
MQHRVLPAKAEGLQPGFADIESEILEEPRRDKTAVTPLLPKNGLLPAQQYGNLAIRDLHQLFDDSLRAERLEKTPCLTSELGNRY